jgi:hypothetical protein
MDQKQQGSDVKTFVFIVFLGLTMIITLVILGGGVKIIYDLEVVNEKLDSHTQDIANFLQTTQEMNEHLEGLVIDMQEISSELETLSNDMGVCRSDIEAIQVVLDENYAVILDLVYSSTGGGSPYTNALILKMEIEYRLGIIIQILEENSELMTNEYAVQLEHALSGWYIGGQKEFEGESTVYLITELIARGSSYEFLRETVDDLTQLGLILQERTGERMAGVPQELDYEAMAEILERLKAILLAVQSGGS